MPSSPLGALVDRFMAHLRERGRQPRTGTRYLAELRRLDVFLATHCLASRIDALDRATLLAYLRDADLVKRAPSARTWNLRLYCLRSFGRFLVREGVIGRNPAEGIDRAVVPRGIPRYLSRPEFDRLLAAVKAHATQRYRQRDITLLVLLWGTGLRVSSVAALDLESVDFAVARLRGVLEKGGHRSDKPMNDDVQAALRLWLWSRATCPRVGEERALFLSDRGLRMSVRAIQAMVARYSRLAGLAPAWPHAIRHGCATALRDAGVPLEDIAELLGHRNLDTTRIYAHISSARLRATAAVLENRPARRAAIRA